MSVYDLTGRKALVTGGARGLGAGMYGRFEDLARARGARGLKAITAPENEGSRAFHEALGFSTDEVDGYSPSGGIRLVFTRTLR